MPTNTKTTKTATARTTTDRKGQPATPTDPVQLLTAAKRAGTPASPDKHSRPSSAGRRTRLRTVPLADVTVPVLALPAVAPDTPTARALWTALHAHPDATSADLAAAAGIGRSTATGLLATLAKAGLAARTPGGGQGRTRQPDRWTSIPTLVPATHQAQGPVTPASTAVPVSPRARDDAEPDAAAPPTGKLAGGQLRDLVAAHLHAHPELEFSPAAIAKTLDRSAGAVTNACVRLTVLGRATQTCASPRRFRAVTAK